MHSKEIGIYNILIFKHLLQVVSVIFSLALISCGDDGVDNTESRVAISSIIFGDEKFQSCVEEIGATWTDEVSNISCFNRNISDISGIEYFNNLTTLGLTYNNIRASLLIA